MRAAYSIYADTDSIQCWRADTQILLWVWPHGIGWKNSLPITTRFGGNPACVVREVPYLQTDTFPSKLSDFLQGCKNYVWTNRRVYRRTMQTRRLATPTRWVINFADLRCDWRVIATAYTRLITNPRCHTQHTYTQVMVNTAKILLMCLVYQATLIGMVHLLHGSAV